MTQQTYDFSIFAEHFQFYVQDKDSDEDLSIYWDEDSRQALVSFLNEIVGIATVRSMDVPITLKLLEKEPEDEALDDWDHVVQGSVSIPSGKLLITGPVTQDDEALNIDVVPGTYGLRAYFGSLDEVDAEGFEGDDFYQVSIWKTDEPPAPEVLKRWLPPTTQSFIEEAG